MTVKLLKSKGKLEFKIKHYKHLNCKLFLLLGLGSIVIIRPSSVRLRPSKILNYLYKINTSLYYTTLQTVDTLFI